MTIPPTSTPEGSGPTPPVEERLAGRLAAGAPPREAPARTAAVTALHELGRLDLAIYRAVAETPTPTLDRPLRRLSDAADRSRLWIAIAAAMTGAARRGGAARPPASPPWRWTRRWSTSASSSRPAAPGPTGTPRVYRMTVGCRCRIPRPSPRGTPRRRSPSPPRSRRVLRGRRAAADARRHGRLLPRPHGRALPGRRRHRLADRRNGRAARRFGPGAAVAEVAMTRAGRFRRPRSSAPSWVDVEAVRLRTSIRGRGSPPLRSRARRGSDLGTSFERTPTVRRWGRREALIHRKDHSHRWRRPRRDSGDASGTTRDG